MRTVRGDGQRERLEQTRHTANSLLLRVDDGERPGDGIVCERQHRIVHIRGDVDVAAVGTHHHGTRAVGRGCIMQRVQRLQRRRAWRRRRRGGNGASRCGHGSPGGQVPGAGGAIGIHGTKDYMLNRNGVNWTHGCISLLSRDIRELYDTVAVGTPVVIQH
jgi:lipoprotein-anchoring transpeptidase ErfK/SrfK